MILDNWPYLSGLTTTSDTLILAKIAVLLGKNLQEAVRELIKLSTGFLGSIPSGERDFEKEGIEARPRSLKSKTPRDLWKSKLQFAKKWFSPHTVQPLSPSLGKATISENSCPTE